MADSSAPQHSSPGSGDSSSIPSADWCAEQWSILCDLLDISDPREVVPRVRRLTGGASSSSTTSAGADEVEQAFRDMQSQLQTLQERNQQLLEHLQSEAPADASEADDPPPDAEALFDHLDVSSMSEAQERVESLTQQLDHLYREKEQLAEAGLMSADDVLDEIDRLQKKCDRLEQASPAPSEAPEPASAPAAAVLEVDDRETADEMAALATEAHEVLGQAVRALDLDMPSLSDTPAAFPDTMRSIRDHATVLLSRTSMDDPNAQIADTLGLDTVEEAREMETVVKRMGETLETVRAKHEGLKDELGVRTTEDVLEMVQNMETQLSSFYSQQEEEHAFADEVEDVLGISTAEEAHELADMVRRMDEHLETLNETHESLAEAGYDAESALDTIENMEEQLVAFYEEQDEAETESADADERRLADAVADVLGLTTPEEVKEMDASVRRMTNRLDTLEAEQQALAEANLTAEDAVDMLDSMNDQLASLYEARDERNERLSRQIEQLGTFFGFVPPEGASPETALNHLIGAAESLLSTASHPLPEEDAPDNLAAAIQVLGAESESGDPQTDPATQQELAAIKERLGISSPEEAEELATMTRNMSNQLEAYRADHEHLEEAGVTSVKSAIDMIKSLSAQLDELYEEQELVQTQDAPVTESQDTFEQLAALYSEQEKLERALGVSDADEVIEMVEALTAQLDDLYADREAASAGPPDLESPSLQPEPSSNGTATTAHEAAENAGPLPKQMISTLEDQLEALYSEKEALLDIGLANAHEAVEHIDELESRLQTLEREHDQCYDRLEQLEEQLGTSNVPEIVDMVQSETAPASETTDNAPASAPPSSPPPVPPDDGPPDDGPPDDAGPALLPDDTLPQLDDFPEAELDDLSVGALRLDDDGRIEYLNEAACTLPGLDDVDSRSELLGEILFEIVPSTSNTLFLNRFRDGIEQGRMDTRFSYTFVSRRRPPTAFFVHLYRAGPSGSNWLLFERAE